MKRLKTLIISFVVLQNGVNQTWTQFFGLEYYFIKVAKELGPSRFSYVKDGDKKANIGLAPFWRLWAFAIIRQSFCLKALISGLWIEERSMDPKKYPLFHISVLLLW